MFREYFRNMVTLSHRFKQQFPVQSVICRVWESVQGYLGFKQLSKVYRSIMGEELIA